MPMGAVITGEEDDAYLEIVSAGSGTSTTSAKDPTEMSPQELRAELALTRERVETERVEKEALQQRINALEQNVGKMKGMLSIEDDELSEIQALGLPAGAESEPTEGELLEADIVEDAEAEMAESIAETDDMLAEQDLEDAISEESAAEEVGDELSEEGEAAIFLDETSVDEELTETPEDAEPMQDEAIVEDVIIQQPQLDTRPPADADPLGKLLSDPVLLAAAGGGLLLILAVIGLIIKKRREAAAETESFEVDAGDDLESLADEVAIDKAEVDSLAGDSEQADADESADENLDSDLTTKLDAAEDTIITEDTGAATDKEEPRDDVIAEADVYLAYGIYQQAEELLTQAITDNPERDDYRVKLAETLYASKNADAFIEVATEIKKRAGDQRTPAWKKVLVMGQDLCADNVLFQGSMVGGLDVDSLAPKTPEMDFDLGIDDAGDASSDSGLSLDDQPLELPDMDEAEEDKTSAEPAGELEFDLSDAGAVEETPAAEDEFSLDIDASELDIDIQEEAEKLVTDESAEVHEVSDVDIEFGLDEAGSTTDDEEVAIDLTEEASALDLDQDEDSAATKAAAPAMADGSAEEEDFDLSSLDDVDEISTKLDLARAYLDMGDNEGTRGILEEVIAEGNAEQKQEANELMAKLN